jgi:hypothetical protein
MGSWNSTEIGRVRSSWPTGLARTSGHRVVRVRNPLLQLGWMEFVSAIPWEWFVTLTFDPKKVWSVSRDTAARETIRWFGDVERYFRRHIGWLAALEQHKSGRWHSHGLLAGVPARLDPLVAIWEGRNGRAEVQPAGNSARRCLYVSKEAAENGEILLGDGLRRFSGNLNAAPPFEIYPVQPPKAPAPAEVPHDAR